MRYAVIAVGLFYLVLAYAGFVAISDDTTHLGGKFYGGNTPDLVWGVFGVNTAMNFIHLLLGAFAVISGIVLQKLPTLTWVVVIGFTLLSGYGVVAALANTGTMSLAITWGDNILHIATAVALAAVALAASRASRSADRAHAAAHRHVPGVRYRRGSMQ
nr:hypothetical protein [Kibdelosporangium sp. MJ126-NF4]